VRVPEDRKSSSIFFYPVVALQEEGFTGISPIRKSWSGQRETTGRRACSTTIAAPTMQWAGLQTGTLPS